MCAGGNILLLKREEGEIKIVSLLADGAMLMWLYVFRPVHSRGKVR
jgi:hypothetical protein